MSVHYLRQLRFVLALMFVAAVVAPATPVFAAQGDVARAELPIEDYFVVTRVDARACLAPKCGGFFVARVNTDVARCADGTWRPECHALWIRFPGGTVPGPRPLSGVTGRTGQPVDLEAALAHPGRVLIRGQLERRRTPERWVADVLVAYEVWLGQTGARPRGHFSRLEPLNLVCLTYPCAQYDERSLNTNQVDSLAGLRVGSPSLPLPVPFGSFLAAGAHQRVTGPGGSMNVLVASEVYERLLFAVQE